jgi:O-antigen/teichoic acid export membrane protein
MEAKRSLRVEGGVALLAGFGMPMVNTAAGLWIARSLPTEDYGRMTFFASLWLGAVLVFGFGLTAVVLRDLAEGRTLDDRRALNERFHSLLALRVATAAFLFPAAGAAYLVTRDGIFIHLALSGFCSLVLDFSVGTLQGLRHVVRASAAYLVQPIAYVAFLALRPHGTFDEVITSFDLSFGFALVVVGLFLLRTPLSLARVGAARWWYIRRSLRPSGQIYFVVLFGAFYSVFAAFWLGASGRYHEAAIIGVPATIVWTLSSVFQPIFYNTLFPRLCEAHARSDRAAINHLLQVFFDVTSLFALCAMSMMVVYPRSIIDLTYSAKYTEAASFLAMLAPMTFLLGLEALFTVALLAIGKASAALAALAVQLLLLVSAATAITLAHTGDGLASYVIAYLGSATVGTTMLAFAYARWGGWRPHLLRLVSLAVLCFAVTFATQRFLPDLLAPGWPPIFKPAVAAVGLGAVCLVALWNRQSSLRAMQKRPAVALALILAVACVQTEGSAQASTESCTGSDVDSRHLEVDCTPGFATPHDRIDVFAREPFTGSPWQEHLDVQNAVWIFDAGSTGQAKLIVDFHSVDGNATADLYDDGDGDGRVLYEIRQGIPVVVENGGRWAVRLKAHGGWVIDGKTNFNLDLVVDGPVRGNHNSAFRYRIYDLLKTDGKVDFEIHVRDSDRDGRPDYEWRQDRAPLPEDPQLSGQYRTEIIDNTEGDEIPIQGAVLEDAMPWPFLSQQLQPTPAGSEQSLIDAYAPFFGKSYNESLPPVQIDWPKAKIVQIGEFVASRGNPGNYFIYSINRVREGQDNATNFENPFAFYDLADARDGWPDLNVRMETWRRGEIPSYDNNQPLNIVEYAWDQWHSHNWTYQVSMVGQQEIDQVVRFPDFSVGAVPYADLPGWVTQQTWAAATFVQVERQSYWTDEIVYEWTIEEGGKVVPFQYVPGLTSSAPREAFAQISEGFRGEYSLSLNAPTELYFSPIDGKLHLVAADGGIWNIDGETQVRYLNSSGSDAIDGWQVWHQGRLIEQLYRVPGGLLYSDDEETLYRPVEIPDELFRTLPPTTHEEWQRLGEELRADARDFAPGDLRAMFDQFGVQPVRIAAGPMTNFRRSPDGFRLAVRADDAATRDALTAVTGTPVDRGSQIVSFVAGQWTVAASTFANPALSLTAEDAQTLRATRVRIVVTNPGTSDIDDAQLVVTAVDGSTGAIASIGSGTVAAEGGDDQVFVFSWIPPTSGAWSLEATLSRTAVDARTGARVVLGSATQPIDVRAAPMIAGTTAARLGWGGSSAARGALFLSVLVAAGTAAALVLRGRPQRE